MHNRLQRLASEQVMEMGEHSKTTWGGGKLSLGVSDRGTCELPVGNRQRERREVTMERNLRAWGKDRARKEVQRLATDRRFAVTLMAERKDERGFSDKFYFLCEGGSKAVICGELGGEGWRLEDCGSHQWGLPLHIRIT